MIYRVQATTNPSITQESNNALLEKVSMYNTQMDTLNASIKGTVPVPKPPPVYDRHPGQAESNLIIDYSSAVGEERYRYATASL